MEKNIRILNNIFWLPPSNPVLEVEKVSDLIDSMSSSWKGDIIKNLYSSHGDFIPFSLPSSLSGVKDKLNWSLDSKGVYKVATAYRLLTDSKNRSSVQNYPWKEFWKMKIPPMYLIFTWKLINRAIPFPDILQEHHLKGNNFCPFCQMDHIAIDHIFFTCDFAKSIWFGNGISFNNSNLPHGSFIAWLSTCLKSGEKVRRFSLIK